MSSELYIGLMSGTSVDGIDAGLVRFANDQIELLEFEYIPFSNTIKEKIHNLSNPNNPIFLKDYSLIDTLLGKLSAQACNNLLNKTNIPYSDIAAIGSHGQTIYHAPLSYSLQIGDPNIIAEKTGITTVADFRRRDIAATGEGAPLVPAFHRAYFSKKFDLEKQGINVINIGGIANITHLSNQKTIGFDTGPGNTLMDYWIQKNQGKAYDQSGAWAKSGTVNSELVHCFKQDPYFKLTPPKSTGKEYFSPTWLHGIINQFTHCSAKDIQASLCQLTAESICQVISLYSEKTKQTLICGGGIHNKFLMELINNNLTSPAISTSTYGINPDHVEAIAFAWLAKQTIHNLPGNLISVTGAKNPVILGGIYPGKNGLHSQLSRK